MALNTPLIERLTKRREGIRDLRCAMLIVLCLVILWRQQPAATYPPVSALQAVITTASTHAERLPATQAGPLVSNETQTPSNIAQSTASNTLASWLGFIDVQQCPAVLVTALYDIGREKHGRSMEHYKQWFAHTLKIASPMVIFFGRPCTGTAH